MRNDNRERDDVFDRAFLGKPGCMIILIVIIIAFFIIKNVL